MPEDATNDPEITYTQIKTGDPFPTWAPRAQLVAFFHETMQPYHDSVPDIEAALDYCLDPQRDGFIMLAHQGEELLGALTMLDSGMGGYIPRWILLFVSVMPEARGRGIGGKLCQHSLDQCDGPVKLHVEYENPAKRLYERLGFTSKYAEMRWEPSS